jgi:hypothetical protein
MKVYFGTKEEHNKRREEEFLKLSGEERMLRFFQMIKESHALYGDNRVQKKDNFYLIRK